MLRTDLVPSRHLRNNRSRAIRRRDNPALLFLGPATPAANTSPDFNTPKRPPRIVKYIVDHICEPISPNRSTSDELSAPPQGAVKTPLSVHRVLVDEEGVIIALIGILPPIKREALTMKVEWPAFTVERWPNHSPYQLRL